MKDYEKQNISEEEAMKEILEKRNEILDAFCKAYLAETGLNPSQIELVHIVKNEEDEVINIFSFREKK